MEDHLFKEILDNLKIKSHKLVYAPDEDTFLLLKHVFNNAKGNVLEIGSGSGYISIFLKKKQILSKKINKNNKLKNIEASDINPNAIKLIKTNQKINQISFPIKKSNLFNKIKKKYDTIIFNPPYLPASLLDQNDPFIKSVDGGKKGYEITEKFINNLSNNLNPKGNAYIIFSSLTKLDKIKEFISNNLLKYEILEEKNVGLMEKLYVLKIFKSDLLKELENKKIKNIKYFSKGKRGFIYTGKLKNKKVGIKIKNPTADIDNTHYEFETLKKLNKYNIGPEVLFEGKKPEKYFVYKFIEGKNILEFFKDASLKNKKKVIKKVLIKLRILDNLKYSKDEMHNPYKHILINKKIILKVKMIDFERCKFTNDPKNITQFITFLTSKELNLNYSKEEAIRLAKKYSKNKNKENFKKILNYFTK